MGIVEAPLLTVERWERGSEHRSSQNRESCGGEKWEGYQGRGLMSLRGAENDMIGSLSQGGLKDLPTPPGKSGIWRGTLTLLEFQDR